MRLLRLSLLVVLSVSLLAHSLAAPGSAGRDVLAMYKFDLGSLLETQETEDSAQHQAQLHQLESFLTADDEDEEGAEAGQVQAEEAAEMWSAAEGEESSETVAAAATPSNTVQDGTVSKKDGNPYDDLVSIFSALGDKDAVANSQKILNSALTMHSSLNTPSEEAATPAAAAVAEPQQAQASSEAEESHDSHEAAGQEESSEETEDALPLVAAAEDSETATPVSEGPTTRTPVPDTPVPDTPTRAPAPVQNRTNPVPTQAPTPPPAPKFVTLNYVKPVYDDAPNPISPDYEVKAVQGRGGWKKANKVAKDTLGPCNKGDPCPPQPTADNPNPAPTQLQLNKIRADAEIQKHFGDKRVLEPQGWIRPTHAGCEGDCPKIEVSQSTSDGKFVTANSIPSLPVEVRLNCEPKLEGQC